MAAKSIRKSVSFDESDGDRALLDAIASHQSEQQQSFSELCKQALRQYLLSREPTQSVLLFMELQHQIAQLGARVASLEDNASIASAFNHTVLQKDLPKRTEIQPEVQPEQTTNETNKIVDDPVLSRLAPLLEDF
ncbi:MAG: hypothetical protein AAGA46_14080 [Cyanobacteria bacterium P01_F01_bin.13]